MTLRTTVAELRSFLETCDPDAPVHAVIDGANRYRIIDAIEVGFGGRSAVALMLRHESNYAKTEQVIEANRAAYQEDQHP